MEHIAERQPTPMRLMPNERLDRDDAGELSDDDLEHVVGGLARIWFGQGGEHLQADSASASGGT